MSATRKLSAFCRMQNHNNLRTILKDLSFEPGFQERRQGDRIEKKLILYVQPLDEDFQPVGDAFESVTRDFSHSGIGFVHPDQFSTKYIKISPGRSSSAYSIAEVKYQHPSPEADGILIGVQFVDED